MSYAKYLKYIVGIILLTAIDQITKIAAVYNLAGQKDWSFIPDVIEFHYLENQGAAFGILENQTIFFILFGVIVLAAIGFCYHRLPTEKKYAPLQWIGIFISAGAMGNLIDRMLHGYVIDFIYIKLIRFPVFNIADIYVTLSCITLIGMVFLYYKEDEFDFLSIKQTKKQEKRD